MYVAKESLERTVKSEKRKKSLPENAGKAWSDEEDSKLKELFESGATVPEMATRHQRSKGSITARLIRLGKLEV